MDFLDPQKERLNRIVLFLSYGLVSVAIGIASIILLYQTNGYCVDGKGAVDRCGLVFLSSQPNGATITINGKIQNAQTNTKLNLRSGLYQMTLGLDGYRDWRHNVSVLGGDVQRFDYPLLFPKVLRPETVASTTAAMTFATQSPDRRWLLIGEDTLPVTLRLFDIKSPTKPIASMVSLPAGLITAGDGAQDWKVAEWSSDNRHLVLLHGYTTAGVAGHEYILVDRQTPEASRSLTRDLALAASDQLSLYNKKYDQYYLYNSEAKTLRTAGLSGSSPSVRQIEHVIAYKTYADDTVLYVTDTPFNSKATTGFVGVVLQQGNQTRVLRQMQPGASAYLLDIAQYSGDWYVVLGADKEKGVYIYKNPLGQQLTTANALPVPIRSLRIPGASYVAFSANTQYILAENGQTLAVYDIEYDNMFRYALPAPLDPPQQHVSWMDGNRLAFVSDGKVNVCDFDGLNLQVLQPSSPAQGPFFSPDFKVSYAVVTQSSRASSLTKTPLTVL